MDDDAAVRAAVQGARDPPKPELNEDGGWGLAT
jgi:hypothetical protein